MTLVVTILGRNDLLGLVIGIITFVLTIALVIYIGLCTNVLDKYLEAFAWWNHNVKVRQHLWRGSFDDAARTHDPPDTLLRHEFPLNTCMMTQLQFAPIRYAAPQGFDIEEGLSAQLPRMVIFEKMEDEESDTYGPASGGFSCESCSSSEAVNEV